MFLIASPAVLKEQQWTKRQAAIAAAREGHRVNLEIKKKLDVTSIGKAKEVLREMYGRGGRSMRVDHKVNQISPRAVEVSFEVVEICECD